MIEFAQKRRELFLLRAIQAQKNLGDAFFEQGNCRFVKLGALIGKHNVDDPAIALVALTHNQLLFFETIDNTGEITNGHHHLGADLAERQAAGITDRRQDVKLGWGDPDFSQSFLELLMRYEPKTEEADPEAGGKS